MQHGLACSKDEDKLRALSEQGQQDVKRIADSLRAAGVRVERAWHSGKLRAEQTADYVAKRILTAGKAEQVSGIAPNDPVEEFCIDADVWQEDTLVVGHLPFMSRMVSLLISGDASHAMVEFRPGSVVCIERVTANRWVLQWMLRPGLVTGESV